MNDTNLLHLMWVGYSFIVTTMGINVLFLETKIPESVSRMFRFGKASKHLIHKKSFMRFFEVPKRWFSHFYVFSTIYFSAIFVEVLRRYWYGRHSQFFNALLDIFTTRERKSSITPESVIIVNILLLMQVFRRCYECFFVSVYSDAKMNIIHYIVGVTFYFGVGLSLLYEAPGFDSYRIEGVAVELSSKWFTFFHAIGIVVFLIAFFVQYQAHVVLASLRKDKKGKKIVTMKHVIPVGGWFEKLSCPHYFAEIVMYLSANIIMDGMNWTWWLVCLWTVSNQIIAGLMSHQWYRRTFINYPSKRRAVIPYLL